MISISPAGLATTALVANQLSLTVSIKEKLCRPWCVNSSVQPAMSVSYTSGTPIYDSGAVFIPITATVTLMSPSGCCNSITQVFSESFEVSFQGQTAAPTSVTIESVGKTTRPADVKCCQAKSYVYEDSITILIG